MPIKPVPQRTTNKTGVTVKNSDCSGGDAGEGAVAGGGKTGGDVGMEEVIELLTRELHYYFT